MRFLSELATYTLYLGGATFLAGAGLAYAFGTSARRVLGVLVWGGLAVAGVLFLVALADDCYECYDALGVRVSALFLYVVLPAQMIGWIAGTMLGWTLRVLLRDGRRGRAARPG
jgi:predicted membrane protein